MRRARVLGGPEPPRDPGVPWGDVEVEIRHALAPPSALPTIIIQVVLGGSFVAMPFVVTGAPVWWNALVLAFGALMIAAAAGGLSLYRGAAVALQQGTVTLTSPAYRRPTVGRVSQARWHSSAVGFTPADAVLGAPHAEAYLDITMSEPIAVKPWPHVRLFFALWPYNGHMLWRRPILPPSSRKPCSRLRVHLPGPSR